MKITSVNNMLIKDLSLLKLKKYRDEQQHFILDDFDLIKIAYQHGLLVSLLKTSDYLLTESFADVDIYEVTPQIIAKLSDIQSNIGIIGIAKYVQFPEKLGDKIVVLDGVQDPGNGGAIVRSAHAFGFDAVIVSNDGFDLYNAKFIRATKGSFFFLPCQRANIYAKIESLKQDNYSIIVTDLRDESQLLEDLHIKPPFALVLGNEGKGVSTAVKQLANIAIKIPIHPDVESLNVAVAGAICMYYLK